MASRPPENDDVARNRWALMQAVRLGGGAMALIGLLIISGRIGAPELVGYVLVLFGLLDFFFVPTFLARHWRTPGR
jgi:hypothetical protein